MSNRLWQSSKRGIAAWNRLRDRAPVRPIVVIESDDWGRCGLPSLEAMEELKVSGVPIGASPWDYYGLESEDDVARLGDMLSGICDSDGRPACITANFIMANADLERMRQENFQEFRWVPIDQGLPAPWRETLMPAYCDNVRRGVFYPGLHGFTHFNVSAMMNLLRQSSARGERMRLLARHGVPYLASLTPECNFALVERQDGSERFLSESAQDEWIESGVSLFTRAFGRRPLTTCAPGYRADEATFRAWRRHGIAAVQINGSDGISLADDTVVVGRNVAFEPSLVADFRAASAIDAAARIVECGHPIVVCSHSINYMSRFLGQAEEGRRQLAELLRGLLAICPDLRFASDADVVSAWRAKDAQWFRPPTAREIAARVRAKIAVEADDHKTPLDEAHEWSPIVAVVDSGSAALPIVDQETIGGARTVARLGVASLYVLLGNAFTLVVGLPLQIYVARVLGPGGVGIYGILEAGVGTAAGLLGLGIGPTVMRFLPAHLAQGDYGNARALIRLGGLVLLAVGVAAYVTVLIAWPWIDALWPAAASWPREVAAMGLMVPLGLLIYFFQQALRGFQEIRQAILGSSVLQLAVKAVSTVALFAIGLRLDGYILASLLGMVCGAFWLFCNLQRRSRALPSGEPSASAFPQWYRYALITYSGALFGAAVSGLDRFLVGAFAGSGAVGVLLISRQLQNLPDRFNQMLLMAGAPLLSAAHARIDRSERQRIFCLMTDWSVRCALPLVVFLLFFAHPVLALYGAEFAARGAVPLQILVGATLFGLLCGPVGNVALMSGLERQAIAISVATTMLMLLMLLALIPQFAILGAAVAIAVGTVSMKLAMMLLDRWRLDLHWRDRRFLAWVPQAGANIVLAFLASHLLVPLRAAELFALLVAMYAVAIIANVAWGLHKDDRDLLGYVWNRIQALK